ncbi:phosphoribosyltransferase-like protein [Bradyrhizobium iriomotense]|uniref:phosphoribosyltransferase-like protein n=1 Tax=Bradyrhizobium iriomotense TaxID=441950 RepID=UPI001B8A5AF2|nr:HD domain-containing protein [Bradyrhizobium iriomotense]MBR1129496.1 HD domain-containing protein [Bradyrhizobium iriomotense]
MSIEKLRHLKNSWQGNRSLQKRINQALDVIGFDEKYVQLHTAAERQSIYPKKSKQIKDNQWGMMEFDWRAMRIIDSPILQRLRYIRQLGFSYLTYPSAEHSRFIHSLGIGHVVTKFIEAIDRRAQEDSLPGAVKYVAIKDVPGLTRDHLIHAALLHDIGHLPFSHVSEKVLSSQPHLFRFAGKRVTDISLDVNLGLDRNLPLSEILTLIFLLSERFEKFYVNFVCAGEVNAEEALLSTCALISGLPPTKMLTGISELISGAVDADKVDYVNRDALNCGIPVGVDVARVFLRSGIIRASREQIRSLNLKESPATEEFLFVMNSSGLDTIDEILQARTALYQRVYFHAVTRTAERLFGRSLEVNAKHRNSDRNLVDVLNLWTYRDVELLEGLRKSKLVKVKSFISRVDSRTYPKKAYSFSPGLGDLKVPIDEIIPAAADHSITEVRKQVNNTIIEDYLREEQLWKGDGAILERQIKEEVAKIVAAIMRANDQGLKKRYRDKKLDCLIIVGNAHEKQKRHNPIICQNDHLVTVRDYTNAREQQDAFELLKEIGFVLCDEEWRELVFFSSRVVFARLGNRIINIGIETAADPPNEDVIRYITRFLPDYSTALLRSGVSQSQIQRVHAALTEAGYFDDKPWAAEPVSPLDDDCLKIAERLGHFEGFRSWRITARSVAAYLSQFPMALRKPMATALLNLQLFDPSTTINKLAPALRKLGTGADVVAFSSTSGTQIYNWLRRDLRVDKNYRFQADISAALLNGKSDEPLVFVDDNASTGVQARAQFLNYLGVPRSKWPVECQNEDNLYSSLSGPALAALRQREVYLLVSAGTVKAGNAIAACVRTHGLENFKGLKYVEKLSGAYSWPSPLKRFLKDVGRSVYAWSHYKKVPSKLTAAQRARSEENAFGYANAGGLIATLQSVPTGTVTALWCPGVYNGQPWMPLVLRENRLKDLVVG